MITKLKAWAPRAGSFLLAECRDYSVKRGIVVALAALLVKYGLGQAHASVFAEAALAGVMIALSRAQGKAVPVQAPQAIGPQPAAAATESYDVQ